MSGFDTSGSGDRIVKTQRIFCRGGKHTTKLTLATMRNSVSTRWWIGQDFFRSIEFCPVVSRLFFYVLQMVLVILWKSWCVVTGPFDFTTRQFYRKRVSWR